MPMKPGALAGADTAGAAPARPLALGLGAGAAVTLAWLLVGDLGIAIRDRAAQPTALEMLRQAGASDTATSLLLATVPAVISVLLVPWLGYRSDRCRSRHGRRRPFLFVAAPIGCLALLGLAVTPVLARVLAAVVGMPPRACTLTLFCLFWTLFECAALTAMSMFTGLVNDVVPRALLGRFFAAVRIVGLSVGIGFNGWLFALTERHLATVLACAAFAFALPVLAMCLMVREPRVARSASVAHAMPRERVSQCMAHPSFLLAVAVFLLAGLTFAPFNTFYQYYAHAHGVPKATLGALTAAGYAVSIASAFAVGWLVDRRGAVRVSGAVMAAYCTIAAAGWLLVDGAASFQLFYFAHVALSGAYFTAASSLPMALFPAARFVQFNATKDMLVVLATIVVTAAQGPLLDLAGHDYRLTLLSAAICSLLCVACMARLRRTASPSDQPIKAAP